MPTSVRASWITTKPEEQDARPEEIIRRVFPWSDRMVTLTYVALQAPERSDPEAQVLVQWVFVTGLYLSLSLYNVKMTPPMLLSVMCV